MIARQFLEEAGSVQPMFEEENQDSASLSSMGLVRARLKSCQLSCDWSTKPSTQEEQGAWIKLIASLHDWY